MAISRRILPSVSAFLKVFQDHLARRPWKRRSPVADPSALREFLETRSSYVAQYSLYGYLRTRAGTRYPELFSNDNFVVSINIAKWHIWLDCVSDLGVYTGGLIASRTGAPPERIGALMTASVDAVLREAASPAEAGAEFDGHADRVRARLAMCSWTAVPDDGTPFVESPASLVYWAPIVESLKELDDEIVRNSVRYRWQEIRRELRRLLDAAAVLAAYDSSLPPAD
ncbi:MAG: esterase [Gammaproteobacteria bacterium]|nr:esterase [Gammaproteobacteria bacterium]